ncbi:hypothetical protein [Flavobacterium psychrotolerans]|uniref:PAP2 family protein n=1 Tax=Flavobacterium psychrotolerans TaxID=2169410 RepID=A0A2U1JNS7_9FLAO|nr:hypothetical protein [Flavobacterium psychrotolerans]PWA06543.1 hypothetical protein DB895_03765 [Flavobacterium psychrotolerans]
MKKILPVFSYLFHPIFIPVFGTLFFLFFTPNYFEVYQKYLILLQVSLITILIPVSFFYLLRTLGKVDSVMVSELSQRKIPLIIQAVLIIILIQKSITIDAIPELFFFFFGGLISTVLALVFLFAKIKASIHMIGISNLTAFAIGISIHYQINTLVFIAFLILMNGIIAASRLEMKAHTNKELAIGFLIGLLSQILFWCFWL